MKKYNKIRSKTFGDDADLRDETLQEEGAADAAITSIATGGIFRSGVNEAASHA